MNRKPNSRHFEKIQNDFQKSLDHINSLDEKISILKQEIKNKATYDPSCKAAHQELTHQQLLIKKAALSKLSYELRNAKVIHSKKYKRYNMIQRRVVAANKARIQAIGKKKLFEREAVRQKGELKTKVERIINEMEEKSKKEIKELALKQGVRFRAALDKLQKEKLSQENWKLLNASSSVKTEIYRNIRGSFGWTNKAVGHPKL